MENFKSGDESLEVWKVPKGVRYMSDWPWFNFYRLPDKCILNKQIPGCGFTEYCIRGKENVILCSPRKILLQNKYDQHPEVFLVVNESEKVLGTDKNLSTTRSSSDKKDQSDMTEAEIKELEKSEKLKEKNSYERISRELNEYLDNLGMKPAKILVTYDSFRVVKSILSQSGSLDRFHVIADEMQTILHDSRFKPDTELNFLSQLNEMKRVYFVSATPTLKEYTDMLDEFKGLYNIELDWASEDSSRTVKPSLKIRSTSYIGAKANSIINTYLEGKFDRRFRKGNDGSIKEIVSTEAVLYVNSVDHITRIINGTGLSPDQVNILCANTSSNRKKIKARLGKKFDIGRVPLRGDINKMFTFCTRTVYLGADFYSKCARTFIFSDANIDSLAVDISEDLPQILGRQRDIENPWKNSAEFYYRPLSNGKTITEEDFNQKLVEKKKRTASLIKSYNQQEEITDKFYLAEKYKSDAVNSNYKNDYVAVNDLNGTLTPVMNNLVLVSEIRAFKIQQVDYKDRFTVFSTTEEVFGKMDDSDLLLSNYLNIFAKNKDFYTQMKCLCDSESLTTEQLLLEIGNSNEAVSCFRALGKEKCKALGYNKTRINNELRYSTVIKSNELEDLLSLFNVGSKYTVKYIKEELLKYYSNIGLSAKKINSSDLEKYFELKDCYISVLDEKTGKKKQQRGYLILSKKD